MMSRPALFRLILLCLALVALPTSLPAVVLLNEPFNYSNGSLTTNSSFVWVTHSGATGTTGQTQVVSGKAQLLFAQGEDVSSYLAGQPYLPGGAANFFYAAFTVRFTALPPSAGNYFAHFKDVGPSAGFCARIWALTSGAPAQKFRLGISSTTSTLNVSATNELSLHVDYRVVVRLINTNSVSTLWIDPAAETDPSISSTETAATTTLAMFALRQPASGSAVLTMDDLIVGTTFSDVVSNSPAQPPIITGLLTSQTASVGDDATFTVTAAGTPPLSYQWQFHSTNLPGATSSTMTLTNVTLNDAGPYRVTVTNSAGATNSPVATLTVTNPPPVVPGFSLLTYNVKGFNATDWSTNASQVRAIARQLQHLLPDIITFNEIPYSLRHEMTNFVAAFLPGYSIAISTGTDGSLCSAIASRFSITRSNKWLDGIDLRSFGYSNANNGLDNFTRDLFEAEVAVPGFARPVHVFTTHLKATDSDGYAENAAKRAAEAAAITNFFATNLFALHPYDLYTLSGDMNDDDTNALAIQKLISPATGLGLTNPKNPITGSINTHSTVNANPSSRLDYVFPCQLLLSNIKTGQVFRTDRLTPVPPNLNSNDCKIASDHLPVLMTFNNPYDKPFRLLSIARSNPGVTLRWESVFGQPYRVENSSNLTTWTVLANNLVATSNTYTWTTNVAGNQRFFRVYRVP